MTTATDTSNGTELATREASNLGLHLVVSLDELRMQLQQLERFKRDIMVPDVDYGTIPGTPKPTLLKPGAEKLSLAFGLAPTFKSASRVEDWERGFFHYEERCDLVSKRTGEIVACASGSANSKEPRYRWRDAKPVCLNCGRDLRRSRNRDGEQGEPGWYCWAKAGGCGATFPAAQITAPIGRVENPEPYELTNTILKMAQKRALIAAVLIATGGSGIWTQDVEDLPGNSGERIIETTGRSVPTRERDVDDAHRRSAQPQPRMQRKPTERVEPEAKATDVRCSVCERMVESEALLRDSNKQFNVAYCSTHFNDALDQTRATKQTADAAMYDKVAKQHEAALL